jgi:hypothetical protein
MRDVTARRDPGRGRVRRGCGKRVLSTRVIEIVSDTVGSNAGPERLLGPQSSEDMSDRDASHSCTDVIFEAFDASRVAETCDFAATVNLLRIAQTDVATADADQRMLPAGICDHPPVAKASRGHRVLWLAEWIHRNGIVPFSGRCFRLAGMHTIRPLCKLRVWKRSRCALLNRR